MVEKYYYPATCYTNTMKPKIQALRALTSQYALTVLNPILRIAAAIVVIILIGLIVLVVKVSLWWLILLVPFIGTAVLVFVLGLLAHVAAHVVAPEMNKAQKRATKEYVANLKEVAEGIQTPQFMIVFYVIRDVLLRKWETGFVQQTTKNSMRLKSDFEALVKQFEQS